MLKRIRTVTRSTSVEVYDRAIAMTVEEHCLDFTPHFDSVCTVSVKNICTVTSIVEHRLVTKKKNKIRAKDMYVFLQVLRIIFKKEKSAIHDCEDINKYVANGKNICVIDIRTVTAS